MTTPEGTGPSEPPVVGEDTSNITFEQAVFSTTGMGPDIHTPVENGAGEQGWFKTDGGAVAGDDQSSDTQSGGDAYSYHAWEKWYISVYKDQAKVDAWTNGLDELNDVVDQLKDGKAGLMDVSKLWDSKAAVDHYVNWLNANHEVLQGWSQKLNSDDSAFKGKAAYAIRQQVLQFANTLEDLRMQIVDERQTSQGIADIANALSRFAQGMSEAWYQYSNQLRTLLQDTMSAVIGNVRTYIRGMGLVHGTPNYALDILSNKNSRDLALSYIEGVVKNYSSSANTAPVFTEKTLLGIPIGAEVTGTNTFTPAPLPPGFPELSGPLDSPGTWGTINKHISDHLLEKLESLDTSARDLMTTLDTEYQRSKGPLEDIVPPTMLPPPGGGDNGLGGDNGFGGDNGLSEDDILDLFGDGDNNGGGGDDGGGGGLDEDDIRDLFGGGDDNAGGGDNPFGGGGDNPFGDGGDNSFGGGDNPFGSGGDNSFGGGDNPFGSGGDNSFGGGDNPFGSGGDNSFGGGDNPFGSGGDNSFGGGDNPFGSGGDNSFGGGGDNPFGSGGDNSFGGGDNPFGTGGDNSFGNGTVPPGGFMPPPGGFGGSNGTPNSNRFGNQNPPIGSEGNAFNGDGFGNNSPDLPQQQGNEQSLQDLIPNLGDSNQIPPGGSDQNLPGNQDLQEMFAQGQGEGNQLPGGNDPNLPGNQNLQDLFSNLGDSNQTPPGGSDQNLPGNQNLEDLLSQGQGDSNQLPGGNDENLRDWWSDLTGDDNSFGGGNDQNSPGDQNLEDLFSELPGDNNQNLPGDNNQNQPGDNFPVDNPNLPDVPEFGSGDSNVGGGGGQDTPNFEGLPGSGDSNFAGGAGNPDFSGGSGSDFPSGNQGESNGGNGFGDGPGGNSGGNAGGNFGGEGWSDWSGQDQDGNGNNSAFNPGEQNGRGGMPMMPPMMPPGGGGQGDSKERERQTWLSEDDKIWGTDSMAGNGIVGLPSDVANETDEPLAPTHVHVGTSSHRGKPVDQKPAKETTETTEQTANG
ncbi:hypothetical protein [Prauserella cavernicola]|uniref:Uncharacterized protein n=1 Tax=Prauserella cavernicola TaxID=2800127 RepID=A0A934QWA6_9PSEU|nr:hypothetical protein [Prauserella cavernicola]MBK1787785.1 hypothetical protein [Prauserella cavernicola]